MDSNTAREFAYILPAYIPLAIESNNGHNIKIFKLKFQCFNFTSFINVLMDAILFWKGSHVTGNWRPHFPLSDILKTQVRPNEFALDFFFDFGGQALSFRLSNKYTLHLYSSSFKVLCI